MNRKTLFVTPPFRRPPPPPPDSISVACGISGFSKVEKINEVYDLSFIRTFEQIVTPKIIGVYTCLSNMYPNSTSELFISNVYHREYIDETFHSSMYSNVTRYNFTSNGKVYESTVYYSIHSGEGIEILIIFTLIILFMLLLCQCIFLCKRCDNRIYSSA